MYKNVLMFSGGLDSLIGYFYLTKLNGKEPLAVYSALGHKYMTKEVQAVYHIKNHFAYYMQDYAKFELIPDTTLRLGHWEKEDAFIPMRNMFLAMVGALYGNRIFIVCQKGEQDLEDRDEEFFKQASDILSRLNNEDIRVMPLFHHMTKTDMVKWYLDNEYPVELLQASVSCYSKDRHVKQCGMCSSCFRRWVAMSLNGIEEEYSSNPWEWEGARQYLDRAHSDHYIKERNLDIIEALARKGIN